MEAMIFYVSAILALIAGLGVLLHPHPLWSALHFLGVVLGVSGLLWTLTAPMLSLFYLTVYGVSVTGIFVLFTFLLRQTKPEQHMFSHQPTLISLKTLFAGLFAGLILFSILFKIHNFGYVAPESQSGTFGAENLFDTLLLVQYFDVALVALFFLILVFATPTFISRKGKASGR